MKPLAAATRLIIGSFTIVILLIGCSKTVEKKPDFNTPITFEPVYVSGLSPSPVRRNILHPGLAALYYTEFFKRDLKHLPKGKHPDYPSFEGKPIPQLNHQFDRDTVFDSGTNRGVGIRMTGYIEFPDKGVYEMQALSNDGVILYIDKHLVLSDPKQHADRLSNLAFITIDTPGWYPVIVEYFQRKGTSALKLFWKVPGDTRQQPLPQAAYGHKQ